jgi:hypothetical protein
MTDEEIKQNALAYRNHTKESGETIVEASRRQLAFEAGAHSRDKEVLKLQESIEAMKRIINNKGE